MIADQHVERIHADQHVERCIPGRMFDIGMPMRDLKLTRGGYVVRLGKYSKHCLSRLLCSYAAPFNKVKWSHVANIRFFTHNAFFPESHLWTLRRVSSPTARSVQITLTWRPANNQINSNISSAPSRIPGRRRARRRARDLNGTHNHHGTRFVDTPTGIQTRKRLKTLIMLPFRQTVSL